MRQMRRRPPPDNGRVTTGGTVLVMIEAGRRRVFASALDWPGWSRSGGTERLAIAELEHYRSRYAAVAARAGLALPGAGFEVALRAPGISTDADFGSLGKAVEREYEPVGAAAAHRLAGLLEACWDEFDRAAAAAPALLPRGPRGGGRDISEVIGHVLESEALYAARLGLKVGRSSRPSGLTAADLDSAEVAALRARIAAVIRSGSEGEPGPRRSWPLRYAARRIGWHVLDHAWQLAGQSGSGPAG